MSSARIRTGLFLASASCLLLGIALPSRAPAFDTAVAAKPGKPRMIEWMELLPANERRNAPGSGEPQHDYLGEEGPEAKQQGSAVVNPALNNQFVRMPGFIVPMTLRQEKIVTEFLLVPYYGACIHVPPPPPNQIVYVKLDKATPIKTIWEPYWITGTLTTRVKDTRTASTAYTLEGIRIEPYQ